MKKVIIFSVAILMLFLTGCAEQIPYQLVDGHELVGFWHGLWHGLLLPISWFVSLFSDNTAIYAVYNNGGWYDFGFMLGVGGFSGSSSAKITTRR